MFHLLRRLIYRIGHRGSFLLFLALLDVIYGYSILSDTSALRPLHLLLQPQSWGIIWLTVGIVLLTGVPVRHDRVQYGIAAALKGAWAVAWVNVALTQSIPRAWLSIVIWAAFAALVVVVSSWPELRRKPAQENGKRNE